MIDRAIGNILRNAAKYANRHISLAVHVGENSSIEISVDDDGPGIPEDQRDHIFEPFYRLDRSRDRTTGGFGLGLAIALKAVRLHGGSIHVGHSQLGGAQFIIRLPVLPEKAQPCTENSG
jgi:signal transduction histidine kinase